jgi:hypothetical protein
MKIIVSILVLLFSFSTFSNEQKLYQPILDNVPVIDFENEVYMGDRMIEQRTGMYVECLTPKFSDKKKKIGGMTLEIKAEEPLCKKKEGAKGYFPINYINGLQGTSEVDGGMLYEVRLKGKKEGKLKLCLVVPPLNAHCKKKLTSDDFYYETVFKSQKDTFQRVIEYAGKKGNIVKFIYSEFKDNMVRDAFMREFEVDLSEGSTVAYKGLVFDILNADNATISYKVIRHFEN